MAENCTHDCSSCSSNCASRKKESMLKEPHKKSSIKKVIGIVSGKGGVGKSLVTSLLATATNKAGYTTAVLDADITGPSIPKAFGIVDTAVADDKFLLPLKTATGISVMSMNCLLEDETSPVIWRGPVIAGVIKQFWTDVRWGEIDTMFVDCPPGTGDVPLTVFQSLPIEGIIIVTTPQDLVSMIVEKAVNMARMMNVPIVGIVENMSYFTCPDCGKEISVFGESHIDEIAIKYGIKKVVKLPIVSDLRESVDSGIIEFYKGQWLDDMASVID